MRIRVLSILIIYFLLFILFINSFTAKKEVLRNNEIIKYWQIQSIDTVKYSRDLAREKLNDKSFDADIDKQISIVASTGASHVAIGTPYDDEFTPYLRRWVRTARKYGLKVWYRGNLSGWEKWFGYKNITREEHIKNILSFINKNTDLFEDGDIFTSCTECENGGPGDPRATGDINGHRSFLISEYKATQSLFNSLGKDVKTNFMSMNGDVANLIMDTETTKALGNIVVIDHYVKSPEVMAKDLALLANKSGGKIVLGEFGAPVLDINGNMTERQQAEWIQNTLLAVSKIPSVIGVNYWTSVGGSTGVWDEDYKEKQSVGVLKSYFNPTLVEGFVKDETGATIPNVKVISGPQIVLTDKRGRFVIAAVSNTFNVSFDKDGYFNKDTDAKNNESLKVVLERENKNIIYRIGKFLNSYLKLR